MPAFKAIVPLIRGFVSAFEILPGNLRIVAVGLTALVPALLAVYSAAGPVGLALAGLGAAAAGIVAIVGHYKRLEEASDAANAAAERTQRLRFETAALTDTIKAQEAMIKGYYDKIIGLSKDELELGRSHTADLIKRLEAKKGLSAEEAKELGRARIAFAAYVQALKERSEKEKEDGSESVALAKKREEQKAKDMKTVREASYRSERAAELGREEEKYLEAVAAARRLGTDLTIIHENHRKNVAEINTKYDKAENDEKEKARIDAVAKENEDRLRKEENARNWLEVMAVAVGAIISLVYEVYNAQITALQDEYDARYDALEEFEEIERGKLDIVNEYRDKLNAMDEEDRLAKIEALEAERDAAIAAGNDVLAKEKQRAIDRLNLEKQAAVEDKKIADEKAVLEKKLAKERIDLENEEMDAKYEIQKEQFAVNKALALIDAAIKTASAVLTHLAFPPLAIATGLAGAVQVGIIAAQKPPPPPKHKKYAMGGTLGGFSNYGDQNPFMGNRGETIINTSEGQNLYKNLERSGMLSPSSSNVTSNNNSRSTYNQGRTINIFGPVTLTGEGEFESSVNKRLSLGGTFT
jgi:hypothetical protein